MVVPWDGAAPIVIDYVASRMRTCKSRNFKTRKRGKPTKRNTLSRQPRTHHESHEKENADEEIARGVARFEPSPITLPQFAFGAAGSSLTIGLLASMNIHAITPRK